MIFCQGEKNDSTPPKGSFVDASHSEYRILYKRMHPCNATKGEISAVVLEMKSEYNPREEAALDLYTLRRQLLVFDLSTNAMKNPIYCIESEDNNRDKRRFRR